jgi:hypothetical protein
MSKHRTPWTDPLDMHDPFGDLARRHERERKALQRRLFITDLILTLITDLIRTLLIGVIIGLPALWWLK